MRSVGTMSRIRVLGFDFNALIKISDAMGYDTDYVIGLLHRAETGMIQGRMEMEE